MTTPIFLLDHFELINVHGADAEAFLQAQLSNDLRELDVGATQWNALLSPQGRVMAVFLLARTGAQQYFLLVPHHGGATLLEALRKFVLRRKVQLTPDSTQRLYGANADPGADARLFKTKLADAARVWMIGPANLAAQAAPADWAMQDLEAGFPWLPEPAVGRHLPHALALDKLPAISLKKGCYPGQEIVARTHYLGRSKRSLCLLRSKAVWPVSGAGMQLRDPENQLAGELVDTVPTADGTLALAVVSDERIGALLCAATDAGGQTQFDLIRRF